MPGAVRAAPGCDDASFDALEAGGTVEGLFDFVFLALVRCLLELLLFSAFVARRVLSGVVSVTHPPTCVSPVLDTRIGA